MTTTTKNYFFKSIKRHTFLEPQDQSDLNDDDDNNDDDNNNNINGEIKKEDDDAKKFFSEVSSVIPFWNHKLGLI